MGAFANDASFAYGNNSGRIQLEVKEEIETRGASSVEASQNRRSVMANDNATRLAQHIVEDLKGNAYYEDRQVLAGLISGHLAPAANQDAAARLADAILADQTRRELLRRSDDSCPVSRRVRGPLKAALQIWRS